MGNAPVGRSDRVDVVVVGGGSAAYAAAIAARQEGAERVVMLEKAPEHEAGGNPRFSHSGFRWVQDGPAEIRPFLRDMTDAEFARLKFEPYTAEQFNDHLTRATRGRMDPELRQVLVGESNAALHWLRELDFKWAPDSHIVVDGIHYFEPGYSVHPLGGGLGQLSMLREIAEGLNIELRFQSKVTAIHGTEHGVDGVRVSSPSERYDIEAAATVLCSGGFQANREMRARYLGPNADLMKVRGSKHNTGEVLEAALQLGARAAGHWRRGHSSVVDANAPDFGIAFTKYNRYAYPYGISVNSAGQRFVDEASDLRMFTYAEMGWITLSQPGGVTWQIFDARTTGAEITRIAKTYQYAETAQTANTIEELADKLGVRREALRDTVDAFNDAVDESVPFDPTERDGRQARGLDVPKSNWANKIDRPPYVAYPVTAGITFTFGGLEIDTDARVIGTGGEPIPRLYAAGDITGIFYHGYVGSTGQTRNVVFARRAAAHLARAGANLGSAVLGQTAAVGQSA